MDIKFILLVIGLFIFTLGYVNQNKYNCNINPSLNKMQERDLQKLFYDNSAFLDYERNIENEDGTIVRSIRNIGERLGPIKISSGDHV
tara:strand:- start:195 stop:458 length:264 start_codon:yes stop_codon:yes gene_type:complete